MRLRVLSAVVLVAAAAGCGGTHDPSGETVGSSAACVLALEYEGDLYLGYRAGEAVVQGTSLGHGSLPPCDDTGPDVDPEPAEEIDVAAIEGVSPSIAVVWQDRDDDMVYVRDGVDLASLPAGLLES